MGKHISRRVPQASGSLIIALGISAIDVLCCALVGALVLFLILSVEARKHTTTSDSGENQDLVFIVSYTPSTDPRPVLRLRIYPPRIPVASSSSVEAFSEYWTDSRDKRYESASMFRPAGGSLWSVAAASQTPQISVLHIHRPAAGVWGFSVGYVDSSYGAISSNPPQLNIAIAVLGHGGGAKCDVFVPVGEVAEKRTGIALKLASGTLSDKQSCQGDVETALSVPAK
jgi:hypothetical protein